MAGASSAAKGAKAMKPSGVEWLGDIPQRWEVMPAKALFKQEKRPTRPDDEIITAFRDGQVTLRKNRRTTGFTEATNYDTYQGIRKGDLVIHQMDAFAGCAGISDSDGMGSPILIACTPRRGDIEPRYYAEIVRIMGHSGFISALAKGVRERSADFRFETFARQLLPLPPLPEQRAIADYLDAKCGAIYAAIAEAKKGIEEYKAWKKSLIFEAVTGKKNLKLPLQAQNRVRKMKPSGILWIGDVPEGWEVRRLKFVFDEITDGSHFSPETTDEGYPYITATDVRGIGIDFTKTRRISNKDYETLVASGCKIKKGDVLLVKDGATTGRTGLMVDNVNCVGLSSVAMLRTAQNNNRFLMYLLDSDVIQKQILLAMAGSAMPRITIAKINEFYGLLPPLSEQQAIADYLDEKCAAIDAMVAEKEALIVDLEAYKKSLIYEVVTGKEEPKAAAPGTKPTASGTGQGVA